MVAAKTVPITDRFMWVFNTLFHQCLAVVTIYIFWTIIYNNKTNTQFGWHMILSTLAYVPLMGEAIILFANDNVWSRQIDRTTKYWIHGVILIISCILVTVGIALMIDQTTGEHFKSIHGWTGLVSWIFVLLSQVLGLASAKAQLFSPFLRPVYVKLLHNCFGLLGYVFGIVSLAYGLTLGPIRRFTSEESRTGAFCLLGITTAWSILAALQSAYGQIKTILKS